MNLSLSGVLPPVVRKWAYVVAATAAFVLGALQVGYGSADVPQPAWLDVAFDVLGYSVVALGLVAAGNVTAPGEVVKGYVEPVSKGGSIAAVKAEVTPPSDEV